MDAPRTFESIWYRSKPVTESTKADPFIRERGRLVVEGDAIRFEGRQNSVVMRDIEAVEYGVHGSMTNPSVHVRYREGDEERSAWLTDGGLGGYSGMFGGTRRLAQALGRIGPATFDDDRAGASQKRLALFIGGSSCSSSCGCCGSCSEVSYGRKVRRMRFGMYARLVAKSGERDALTAILLRGVEGMRAHGCQLYVVNHATDNPNAVWVWDSREAHAASLQLPETRQAIAEAMPLLTGEFQSIELDVVGGLGVPGNLANTTMSS